MYVCICQISSSTIQHFSRYYPILYGYEREDMKFSLSSEEYFTKIIWLTFNISYFI